MEISTVIDKKKNIRWHIVKGVIDVGELTEYLKEIYNSSDLHSEMNVFWDLQKADFSSVPTEEIKSFIIYVANQWGQKGTSKAALVVSHDFGYGISRMYQMMMEGESQSEIAIFRDINEAKK